MKLETTKRSLVVVMVVIVIQALIAGPTSINRKPIHHIATCHGEPPTSLVAKDQTASVASSNGSNNTCIQQHEGALNL